MHIKCYSKKSKPIDCKFDSYGKTIAIFDS